MSETDPAPRRPPRPNRRPPRPSRRQFLGVLSGGIAGFAGCLGDEDDENGDDGNRDDAVDPELQLNGYTLSSGFPLQLFDPETGQLLGEVHYHSDEQYRHWHFMPFEVPSGGTKTAIAEVVDDELEVIPVGDDEQFRLELYPTAETPDDLVEVDVSGDVVTVRGHSPGSGGLLADLVRTDDDEVLWQSPELWVEVVEQ